MLRWVASLSVVVGLVSINASADGFCEKSQNLDYFRDRSLRTENRIAFENPSAGALGLQTGLCWWHSRLQRSFLYLAKTRALKANEKPMSKSEVKSAVSKLIAENSVVDLRGYNSIFDFTYANEQIIHSKMKWWQAREALMGLRGLSGKPVVSAQEFEKLMHQIYDFVENKRYVGYEMLQLPGVSAHAWLVSRVLPIYENLVWKGYELWIIDSNMPAMTYQYAYRTGQTHFTNYLGDFTPYLQWESSMKRYASAILHHCKPKVARAQVLANLQSLGDRVVATVDDRDVTATEMARDLILSKQEIPGDIARKFTFSDEQFKNLSWKEASSGAGINRMPARQGR